MSADLHEKVDALEDAILSGSHYVAENVKQAISALRESIGERPAKAEQPVTATPVGAATAPQLSAPLVDTAPTAKATKLIG